MTRTLAWIAGIGLSGGIVLVLLAFALGGRGDLAREANWRGWLNDTCRGESAGADTDKSSERHWAWKGGDTVEIALPGTVFFHAGQGNEVIARGSPGALASLEVRGGRIVSRCWRSVGAQELEITLPGQALRKFIVSGSTTLTLDGLAQRDLDLQVSGSGEVDAAGSVDHAVVSVAGSGSVRLGKVTMKRLTAHISGSGNIEAAPTDLADIKISGSGDVHLRGRPTTLRSHISGSGHISQTAALEPN